jgi:hypothetical protein
VRYSIPPVLKTKMRQTILHSITDIVAVAAADVMDMEKDKDRAGDSISRTLTVRRPRCRESNNYKSLNASTERGGYSEMPFPF